MSFSKTALAIMLFAAVNGLIAQICEGYAAHGLEDAAGSYAPTLYHTSAKYHMWHVLAMLFAGLIYDRIVSPSSQWLLIGATVLFGVGMASFSGGMYAVPFGGSVYFAVAGAILLQIAWGVLALAFVAALMGRKTAAA